jgi:tRNA(adenine34) deaminase
MRKTLSDRVGGRSRSVDACPVSWGSIHTIEMGGGDLTTEIERTDRSFMQRAIEWALRAEGEGNLPIGCVICRGETIVAEGRNNIWVPEFKPHRHAEMEALKALAENDRTAGDQLTLYTTLEPCLMCAGAISLHKIGRVVFGSLDPIGGAVATIGSLPPYFARHRTTAEWVGPAWADACDPLYARAMELIRDRDAAPGKLDHAGQTTDG